MAPLKGKKRHHCGGVPKKLGNHSYTKIDGYEYCETHNWLCYECDKDNPYIVNKEKECPKCKGAAKSQEKQRRKDEKDKDEDEDGAGKGRGKGPVTRSQTGVKGGRVVKNKAPEKTKKQIIKENKDKTPPKKSSSSKTISTLDARNTVSSLRLDLVYRMIMAASEDATRSELAEILRLLGSKNTEPVLEIIRDFATLGELEY